MIEFLFLFLVSKTREAKNYDIFSKYLGVIILKEFMTSK